LGAENRFEIMVLHVAPGFSLLALPDELTLFNPQFMQWEAERMIVEANLDLSRFLEAHRNDFREFPIVKKKVLLGTIAEKILDVASQESMDLIVMSPRQHRAVRRLFSRSITDRITREAPCPVLSVCPSRIERPSMAH
jgi:nucleotide-binding universal stress UspA family protein